MRQTEEGRIYMAKGQTRIMLEGQTIGRLYVIEPMRLPGRQAIHYRCRCSCGQESIVNGQNLRRGMTQSCGCLQRERAVAANLRHGLSKTTLHNIWLSMLQRCEDPKHHAYADYGGRGITVAAEWHSFEQFLADMGRPVPGMTLDRRNNDAGYSKDNCRWATRRDQANNRRSNRIIEFRGQRLTMAEWERKAGMRRGSLWERLDRGWSVERALGDRAGF